MITSVAVSNLYVLDLDHALDFYVAKLGMEVAEDVDLGFMRWLTIKAAGPSDHEILLQLPTSPSRDQQTSDTIAHLVSLGAAGWVGLATDDCQRTYDTLVARGVEFTEPPTERGYGIDCAARDPFGNMVRITQLHDVRGDDWIEKATAD